MQPVPMPPVLGIMSTLPHSNRHPLSWRSLAIPWAQCGWPPLHTPLAVPLRNHRGEVSGARRTPWRRPRLAKNKDRLFLNQQRAADFKAPRAIRQALHLRERCSQSNSSDPLRHQPLIGVSITPEFEVQPTPSVGDSYDNALAETINGLYKAEVSAG
jgi:hypothetical protein